ncbi:MAG TPA: FHA domain-containing serine/threonine-protein kinase [Ktedonobacteraceae bacterium]|jgi:serine/threonine-protein kinase
MAESVLQLMENGRISLKNVPPVHEVELLQLLGMGGFGSAWKVADTATKKLYVLKVIQGIKPGSVMAQRVRQEADVRVPSKFIVPVIGLEEWNPTTFLILFEYFEGRSLDKVLEAGLLNGDEKKKIFLQILQGVADAHCNNIIHRDIKPANILISASNEVKIIDFGISKFKGAGITLSGEIIGTIRYMAPEIIIRGARVADARCDIYSLGHVLYELAMGQHFWTRKGWKDLDDWLTYLTQTPRPQEAIELGDFHCEFLEGSLPVLTRMVKIDAVQRYDSINEILSTFGHTPELPPMPADLHLRNPLLIVESGEMRGARTVLGLEEGQTRVFGRSSLAGGDSSISREHFEFRRAGDHYYIRDLNSKNGTMVRGLDVTSENPLEVRHTDRVKVGDIFLRFVFYPR